MKTCLANQPWFKKNMKNSRLTFTDQFCGAGGSSQGVRRVSEKRGGGIEVSLALNHWKLAVETHNTNFPETRHDCTDISAVDPRRYPSTDFLITSPECTTHSPSGGNRHKRSSVQCNMFENVVIDEATQRSRATMWDVVRFAEYHQYNCIITENVVEAKTQWVLFDNWLGAMHRLGYLHECVYMNSMFHFPCPQSRDRMYVVFWKKGNKKPNLNFTPLAMCPNCDRNVHAFQSWKNPQKPWGKYGKTGQYIYRCPNCTNEVSPYYYAAFNCIDFSIPSKKIGERKTALKPKTIERIESGLKKLDGKMFFVTTGYSSGVDCRVKPYTDPLATQPGDSRHGFVLPFVVDTAHSSALKDAKPTHYPLFTQTTAQTLGIMIPMLVGNYTPGWTRPITQQFGTVTTDDHHSLVVPPMIVNNFGSGTEMNSTLERLGCVTAGGINYGLLTSKSINSFLSYYNSGSFQNTPVAHPFGTITTIERIGLSTPNGVDINECHYRMLNAKEIKLAMSFDEDYIILGNAREQVKQCGNAVTPPAMEWLVDRCVETFM